MVFDQLSVRSDDTIIMMCTLPLYAVRMWLHPVHLVVLPQMDHVDHDIHGVLVHHHDDNHQ